MSNNEAILAKQLMSQNAFWTVNKCMAKKYGIETSVFLSALVDGASMMANEDGWFYQTIETLESITTLSRRKQASAISALANDGLIEVEVRGLPAKRHFKINYNKMAEALIDDGQTTLSETGKLSSAETGKLVIPKRATNKESIYKESSNKENNNKDNVGSADDMACEDGVCVLPKKQKPDIRPANADLENQNDQHHYYNTGQAKNNMLRDLPYVSQLIINRLNKLANRAYRYNSPSTQRVIKARINEGFVLNDFYLVVETKVNEWINDPKMSKYLRPETLFGTKFESYLNQPKANGASHDNRIRTKEEYLRGVPDLDYYLGEGDYKENDKLPEGVFQ